MSKIAIVAHWDWVLYNLALSLAKGLRANGDEVFLVSPEGQYTARLKGMGFRHHHWSVQRRSLNPLKELMAIQSLAAIYRKEQPDIVKQLTIKPNLYGSIAARIADVPVVVNSFTGLGFLFSDASVARLLRVTTDPLLRWVSHRTGTWTICENEDDMKALVDARLVPSNRVRLERGTGVDISRFVPGEPTSHSERQPVTILMAGRLLYDKGVADLAQASRILRQQGAAVRFLVAGDVDEGNPSSIPRPTLQQWEAEGLFTLLGMRSDMPQVLRKTDIAVLPSYHEGFPRFLLEAAATGLPLVATDIPGCRAIVRPEQNGFLVPPRDPVGLADATRRLIDDHELRHQYGASSRRMVEEEFSEERLVEASVRFYKAFESSA